MASEPASTKPKPFVFVLMPMDERFDDIYRFGIKGAADDVSAYAERLDEQIFTGDMLDRIFNQISKADVIVADMTARNPNVFYEVGYAHALGKTVLLLTQSADDIPFDLKHHQHLVYSGKIETLRSQLAPKLEWAIHESANRTTPVARDELTVRLFNVVLPEGPVGGAEPAIPINLHAREFKVYFNVRNNSAKHALQITHAYLFAFPQSWLQPASWTSRVEYAPTVFSRSVLFNPPTMTVPVVEPLPSIEAHPVDSPDGLTQQCRLPLQPLLIPPQATDTFEVLFMLSEVSHCDERCRLRLHSAQALYDYPMRFQLDLASETGQQAHQPSP